MDAYYNKTIGILHCQGIKQGVTTVIAHHGQMWRNYFLNKHSDIRSLQVRDA
jgi:hypothetical protein